MPRLEQRFRPGSLAYLDRTENSWTVAQPGSLMFSTVSLLAEIYVGADRRWRYVDPLPLQSVYVMDVDNSPTFPGAYVVESP